MPQISAEHGCHNLAAFTDSLAQSPTTPWGAHCRPEMNILWSCHQYFKGPKTRPRQVKPDGIPSALWWVTVTSLLSLALILRDTPPATQCAVMSNEQGGGTPRETTPQRPHSRALTPACLSPEPPTLSDPQHTRVTGP